MVMGTSMVRLRTRLTAAFKRFFEAEQSGGILMVLCVLLSMGLANAPMGADYLEVWHVQLGPFPLEHWINDGLMTVFFLLVGLELERELYVGELSDFKIALLPMLAALGGMLVPALIHFGFNAGLPSQGGFGIPMATDIAFAIGILAILGKRVPVALKVFVVAFAVIDDLGAILVIATFYTADLSLLYLAGALAVWGLLLFFNRVLHLMALTPYLLLGGVMWVLMLKSGVHATISGVMLAFAIPFSGHHNRPSPSVRLEERLVNPVAFFILPVFAIANTAIVLEPGWLSGLGSANSLGVLAGLVLGKPLGVVLACVLAVRSGLCRLPTGVGWRHMIGAGLLGGIGFTMSIFITNLAFPNEAALVASAKVAILIASTTAALSGAVWLMAVARKK
jgi:Na+:H+ antiporter, NhaA family